MINDCVICGLCVWRPGAEFVARVATKKQEHAPTLVIPEKLGSGIIALIGGLPCPLLLSADLRRPDSRQFPQT